MLCVGTCECIIERSADLCNKHDHHNNPNNPTNLANPANIHQQNYFNNLHLTPNNTIQTDACDDPSITLGQPNFKECRPVCELDCPESLMCVPVCVCMHVRGMVLGVCVRYERIRPYVCVHLKERSWCAKLTVCIAYCAYMCAWTEIVCMCVGKEAVCERAHKERAREEEGDRERVCAHARVCV